VAQPHAARAAGRPRADAAGEPLGGGQRRRAEDAGDAVAVGALGLQVGPDAAVPRGGAPVGVEQEQADAVVELPGEI